jgi:hypothetical protein
MPAPSISQFDNSPRHIFSTVIALLIALSVAASLAARPTAVWARTLNTKSTASPMPNVSSGTDCGLAWREVASSNTPGETISELLGVAAVSANDVWSVGITYLSGPRVTRPLIEHWDGSAWSIVPSPDLPSGSPNSNLYGVSAASANDVWAVGSYYTAGYASGKTLIEHWNGTTWSIIPSPNVTGPNVNPNQALQGITAVSANNAWAVGYYAVVETDVTGIPRSTAQTMVQHWDGATWSIVPSPNPNRTGTQGSYLLAIAAASANDVWAVGRYDAAIGVNYDTPIFQTLIEHWDGSAWSVVSSPTPPGQIDYNHLLAVSAASANDVWAVGISGIYTAGFGSIAQTLIEHWNGSAWSIVLSPNPGIPSLGQGNWLYGVSAASANDAWAVGLTATATANGQQTLIEHWDGSAWSVVPNPNPSARDALIGVAGVSAHDVWTTGAWSPIDGSSTNTLTERYSDPCSTAVQLISVISRETHGSAGSFDINLPLIGPRGIECRSGGGNGNYTLVFSFANPLTNVDGASVSSGSGSVASNNIDGNDAHNYIVNLTGVTNAQTITVSLTNVTDSAGNFSSAVSASMAVLVGDTNGDGFVNSADISQTKSQSGNTVTSANFREDVNTDGFINSADISLVKSKSGTALP